MTGYHIRLFKDTDSKMVHFLFTNGLREQIPFLRQYIWKLPRTTLFLLSVLLVLFVGNKYSYISATEAVWCLAATTVAVFGIVWLGAYHIYDDYIQYNLKNDMSDIQHYYIQKKGACFWVAECNREVAGMVAAEPYKDTKSGTKMSLELKRLCVNNAFRGLGIGKALCQTLINFAIQEGYDSVILETTVAHNTAQTLYEHLGFKRIGSYIPSIFLYKLLHFPFIVYRYDIRARH